MNRLDRAKAKIDLRFAFDTFGAILDMATDVHHVEEIQQTLGTLQKRARERRVNLVLRKNVVAETQEL